MSYKEGKKAYNDMISKHEKCNTDSVIIIIIMMIMIIIIIIQVILNNNFICIELNQ